MILWQKRECRPHFENTYHTMKPPTYLGLIITVSTAKGAERGVANLLEILKKYNLHATFLLNIGVDRRGRKMRNLFNIDYLKKVLRTKSYQVYSLSTALNGFLKPGVQMKKWIPLFKKLHDHHHEVGIYAYDATYWEEQIHDSPESDIRFEINKALMRFKEIFNFSAKVTGAPNFQTHHLVCKIQDDSDFLYATDTRGISPFYPHHHLKTYQTLQLPTTLPTLDELLGMPDFSLENCQNHYLDLITSNEYNVMTIRAEWEGATYLQWFESFIKLCIEKNITIMPLKNFIPLLKDVPVCELIQITLPGRPEKVAAQGKPIQRRYKS